jgi:hypothetical protein
MEHSKLEELILIDVQALFGGQKFFLKGNGMVYFETVTLREAIHSRRYKLYLNEMELKELEELIFTHNFFEIMIPERSGLPDEASPALTIRLHSGKERTVWKWESDKHTDFDAIYNWILVLIKKVQNDTLPYYLGVYEDEWKPKAFR